MNEKHSKQESVDNRRGLPLRLRLDVPLSSFQQDPGSTPHRLLQTSIVHVFSKLIRQHVLCRYFDHFVEAPIREVLPQGLNVNTHTQVCTLRERLVTFNEQKGVVGVIHNLCREGHLNVN